MWPHRHLRVSTQTYGRHECKKTPQNRPYLGVAKGIILRGAIRVPLVGSSHALRTLHRVCGFERGYFIWRHRRYYSPKFPKFAQNYPVRVKKYLAEVLEQFNWINILTSMNKLTKHARRAGTWTPRMQTKYRNIDKEEIEIV